MCQPRCTSSTWCCATWRRATVDAWSAGLQAEIAAITGDDAAMSALGVGADFKEFQELFAPRVAELRSDVHRAAR